MRENQIQIQNQNQCNKMKWFIQKERKGMENQNRIFGMLMRKNRVMNI